MTWAGREESFEWAAAARALAGELVSGDAHLVAPFPGGVLVGVIDGLGHGPGAELAARAAVDALDREPGLAIEELVAHCHRSLLRLRGVVMSLAAINLRGATMTWIGIGNVEAVLLPATPRLGGPSRERLLVWGGIVGQSLPTLRPATLPLGAGDVIVLATDGVHGSFADDIRKTDAVERIASQVIAKHARGTDDALVLAVRYRGSAP